jgi:hypothetical protein
MRSTDRNIAATSIRTARNVLRWTGDDLLSQALRHSTIGAAALNGRVRNGIGFYHCARATSPAEDVSRKQAVYVLIQNEVYFPVLSYLARTRMGNESDQVNRGISTGKLSRLP